MSVRPAALLTLLLWLLPAVALAATPVRTVEGALEVPDGMAAADALDAVQDIRAIFEGYEPVVPRIPGVHLDLAKEVVSADGPTIVELPVQGSAFGRDIDERARVTATSQPVPCGPDGPGMQITLDFAASSRNVERRVDRIEITACPHVDARGRSTIEAVGHMYAGYLPEDPALNGFNEAIGARALQGAFIKQVPAVFTAVEAHWAHQHDGLADPGPVALD